MKDLENITFKYPVNDREYDFNNDELTSLELGGLLAKRINQILDFIREWNSGLELRELSSDITNKRKLSPNGDFTGTLHGKSSLSLFMQLDDHEDKVNYLTSQFADGQTGLVVDGGFFEETGIKRNYDGGRF